MSNSIISRDLDLTVYGQTQVDYTVDGARGCDFGRAVAFASLSQAVAIEKETTAFAAAVQLRTRKIEELGKVLAGMAKAVDLLPKKDQKSDDKVDFGAGYSAIAAKYDISIPVDGSGKVTRAALQRGQAEVQYAIDTEDNNLQQDSVSLQGYISKRDNSFTTAAKLVRKFDGSATSIVRNM